MKKTIFFLLLIFSIIANANIIEVNNLYLKILKNHTKVGIKDNVKTRLVDYKNLKTDSDYKKLINLIETFDVSTLKSNNEKKAFWINVYNISAIKIITDNYPIKSIKDKTTLFKSVWDRKVINIKNKSYSLDEIENNILRKMDDPKIHFAIVCASLSCPTLNYKPYYAEKLDAQLEKSKNDFLKNKTKGFVKKKNKIYISKIFKWFQEDFGNINEYLNLPENSNIKYLNYNWSLNDY
ncbi:uncharacterized protein DUF547 [Hypnocyclicus thermotrophus]|uniref:Uncharacterized protein DUF547 n=1 Tax=Hypnocyclicus thermotrophus TaxID=1627895 RepID=A0AA46DZT8_9FUSO|nr:DUF547 domain-containing protein [Hypnocyclicus thermotrophus]TDT72022.1 uncharacterized protein DUF547 [Hypnocyclicus thermotrophus]